MKRPHGTGGAAPLIPGGIPEDRLQFVTLRSIDVDPGIESVYFVFLADTEEWCVESTDDAEIVRAVHPNARLAWPPAGEGCAGEGDSPAAE